MRYFTLAREVGDLDEAAEDALADAYVARRAEITPRLPPALRTLAHDLYLHDAVVEVVTWQPRTHRLTLELVADERDGKSHLRLTLTYTDVRWDARQVEHVARLMKKGCEILRDEVDVEDGAVGAAPLYAHRLLLFPYDVVEVLFRALEIQREPLASWPGAGHFRCEFRLLD